MQGPSDAAYLKERLQAGTYFAVDDGITYSAGLIGIMQAYAASIGLQLVGSAHLDPTAPARIESTSEAIADLIAARHPDGVLYAADSYDGLLPRLLRTKGYAGPLVGGDTILDEEAFIKGAGSGAVNIFSSRAGPDLAAVGRSFRQEYAHRFHVALQEFDALAYDGANIALDAMYAAATQGKLHGSLFQLRQSILPYVANVHWHGATGVTSFDRNGDTQNRIVSMYAIRQGKSDKTPHWIYVGKAPTVIGVSPAGCSGAPPRIARQC
jgi:branched-chain amino acid transport system substrate-binding protein